MTIALPSPSRIWREFHWAFFMNVQGLVLCLRRFNMQVHEGNFAEANRELRAAAVLLRTSASSMDLAASFSKADYENTIRVSMTPPSVESDDFSGLMSFDHAVLIQVWREMKDVNRTRQRKGAQTTPTKLQCTVPHTPAACGIMIVTTVPRPSHERIFIVPPCSFTSEREIASPRPEPPWLLAYWLCTCSKG